MDSDTLKKHPFAKWIILIAAILYFIPDFIERWSKVLPDVQTPAVQTANNDKSDTTVQIDSVSFQHPQYDEFYTTFNNPTNKTLSFQQLMIKCERHDKQSFTINTLNNLPDNWKPFQSIELAPVNIDPGIAKKVTLFSIKVPDFKINKQCQSLQPVWKNGNELFEGERVQVPKGAVMFSNLVVGNG